MVELVIKGADELEALGKALKQVGDRELRLELFRAIRTATKPTHQQIRDSARELLPSRGGLPELIAKSSLSTRTRLSGRQVGVRIVASNRHDIRSLDKGRLRHPLYGDRDHWFQQTVREGWFSRPLFATGKAVRLEVSEAASRVAMKFLK